MTDRQLVLPSISGWYGPTEVGSTVYAMDGSRPRRLERRPLLIGEHLSVTGEGPHGPLSARPSYVLAGILGVTYETFLCLFDRVNLLKHWASRKLPLPASLRVMAGHLSDPPPGEPVILLGRRVAVAFGIEQKFHEWACIGRSTTPCVVVPHASGGRSATPAERARVAETMRRALLYHGKVFRVGDYPHGTGSMVMIQHGEVWGDAGRRLKHRTKGSTDGKDDG